MTTALEMSDGSDGLFANIKKIAGQMRNLHEYGIAQYAPIVENISATRNQDVRHIEQTLDREMWDAAADTPGVPSPKDLEALSPSSARDKAKRRPLGDGGELGMESGK